MSLVFSFLWLPVFFSLAAFLFFGCQSGGLFLNSERPPGGTWKGVEGHGGGCPYGGVLLRKHPPTQEQPP